MMGAENTRRRIVKKDLIVLGVVAGVIVLLMAAALLGIAFLPRPQEATASTPEAVVYNFYLALEDEEYEKAYGYLSTPDRAEIPLDEFCHEMIERHSDDRVYRVECRDARVYDAWAFVTVRFSYSYDSGPTRRYEYACERTVKLVREEGAWRIERQSVLPWW